MLSSGSADSCNATLGLALATHAQGDRHAAHQAVEELQRCGDAVPGPHYGAVVRSFKARLLLLEQDVQSAVRYPNTIDQAALQPATVFEVEVPRLTEAQVFAGQDTLLTLRAAQQKLDDLVRWHTERHEDHFAIRSLALWALVLRSQGHTPEALTVLQRAVAMGAPGRFVHSFVDLGPPMRDLLGRLHADDTTALYLSHLVSRFPRAADTNVPHEHARSELTESLSAREAEVLDLLVRRFSNKEIAQQLKISDLTVKRHTVSLYQKLQVHGRQAAVARAVNLGLVTANWSKICGLLDHALGPISRVRSGQAGISAMGIAC